MTVRKVAVRASAGADPPNHTRKGGRARLFLLLTLGAGAGAGVAALIGNSILLDLQNLVIDVHSNIVVQPIEAKTLFPPVPPQHQTIDVYDPPATSPANPSPKATPKPSPSPSPRRSPRPTPSGTPTPDD